MAARLRLVAAPEGLLILAALAVKLAAVAQLAGHPLLQPAGGLDSEHYLSLAGRVASGDFALEPGAYYLPPLYTYFLGVVLFLTGHSLAAARAVQALLGAAAVWLIYLAGRSLWGRRAGLWAMGLAAATGLFTFYEVLLIQAALDPFLVALALFALVRAAQAETGRRGAAGGAGPPWLAWLGAGAALGAFVLNRPNALAVACGLALLLLAWPGRTRRLVSTAAFAAGLVLAVAPVTLRNLAVTGEPVLVTSHGGLNFYIGNNPEADGTYHQVPGITPSIAGQAADMRRVAEDALGRRVSDTEVSGYFYDRAFSWILEEPAAAARLFLRKIAYTFHAAFLPLSHSYPYYARDERTVLSLLVVGPWLLVPLGVFGFAVAWRRSLEWVLLAAAAGLYALSVAAFFVSARYRLPLLVPLCLGAGAGVEWWLRAGGRPRRQVAAAAAALAALALAANRPLGLDDGRFEERVRMALALVAAGQDERAEAVLAGAGDDHPSAGLMHYRAGLAYASRQDYEAARRHLERALALDPGQGEIELSLGQTLFELGRFEEAAAHLRRALEQGVRPEAARAWLARALEQQGLARAVAGDPEAAFAPLDEARRLAPGQASVLLNLAVVCAQLGRVPEARALAAEALAVRPDYDRARRLLLELR